MENEQQLREILLQLEKSNKQQARYARLQCFLSIAAAICFIALVAVVVLYMPKLQEFASQAEEFVVQAEVIMTNLEQVTTELTNVEFVEMVNDVDTLVESTQEGLEQTLEKMNSIDLETLNTAIDGLAKVVEPLAKFFKVFG